MAYNRDCLPGSRAGILAMCLKWLAYMTEALRTLWGIPQAEYTALGNLAFTAQAPLAAVHGRVGAGRRWKRRRPRSTT